ncbi:MAG: hypothetical protein RL417_1783, partial [Pseudomonadota bacterium]
LNPEFRIQLAKLEKGFGYVRTTSISADLPPLELHERLTRIIAALNEYRGAKKRAEAAESESAEAAAAAATEGASPEAVADEALPPGIPEDAAAGN